MRIITFGITICWITLLVQSADEHRPKKKEKRQLDYAISQYYSGPHSYRLERRISNGPQHPHHYSQSQYYPGPPRPYRKDPSQDLTDNHHLSDPIDRGGIGGTLIIPSKPFIKVVEKPVFIKEPEPIIEIIIKESNVTLPPPPTEAPPPPPKKKKEEVQVFYVKYKKNPNGYGKDAVIYDKPIPAISPVIPEEPEPEEEWKEQRDYGYGAYSNEVTEPPRPSTTLRTIIKPDSEVYHSPGNNIKVTFNKEGFDYDKRSSKPEDYPGPVAKQDDQFPRARQLSSFSDVYFKRPSHNTYYQTSASNEYRSEVRSPQPYRPFNNFPSSNQYNSRPFNREFNNRPLPSFFPPTKHSHQNPAHTKPSSSQSTNHNLPHQSSRPSFPSFSHSISHPPPSQYQTQSKPSLPTPSHQPTSSVFQNQFSDIPPPGQRQPVPYTPFENLRPSQPTFSQPLPSYHHHQSFNQLPPTQPTVHHHQSSTPQLSNIRQTIQFRPEIKLSAQQVPVSQSASSFAEVNNQYKVIGQAQQLIHKTNHQTVHQNTQQQIHKNIEQAQKQDNNQFNQHQQIQHHQQQISNDQTQFQEHLNNLRTAQKIIPPGGELLQSLPKYEQHLVVDPATGRQHTQSLPRQGPPQQYFASQQQHQQNLNRANKQVKSQDIQSTPQLVQRSNSQGESAGHHANNGQIYSNQRHVEQTTHRTFPPTTPKPTTTTEPEKPSTTTKDPKILEAQLPAEVPDELRQQLLSSGILNNADISILDYDKVGDIPLSALPPEQLANFYNAGGAEQLAAAGSEPVPQVAALTSRKDLSSAQDQEMAAEESEVSEVAVKPNESLEMKVVKYNPETDNGQKIQESYISEDAKQVDPVILNDNSYNRYLPLKINGTQFPIPDVPELKGKSVSSVVVLAPITYDFSTTIQKREAKPEDDIHFIENEPLKELLANPTQENYKKFLENEQKTATAKQAVILLVTGSNKSPETEKEIYMYDVGTNTVSKLSGELSSAFVEAAEANSSDEVQGEAAGESNISQNGDDNQSPPKDERRKSDK